MAKDFSYSFYHSRQWKDTRKGFVAYRVSLDGGLCEICKDKLGKIAHHKVHLTPKNIRNSDVALGFNNLQFVCHECHMDIHGVHDTKHDKSKTYTRRFIINADGTIMPNNKL